MKKKTSRKPIRKGEMRPEYDFSGGVRNRFAPQLKENGYSIRVTRRDGTTVEKRVAGQNTITLEPDVQEYFPNSQAVNRALRTLLSIIPEKQKPVAKKAVSGRKVSAQKSLKA